MKLLDQSEFRSCKTSDTIVIYGCGMSIRGIMKSKAEEFDGFDTVGFNWFCKSSLPTTFYLIREQCVPDFRSVPGETMQDLYGMLASPTYKDTCFVVHKSKFLRCKNGNCHTKNLDKIPGKGIVVKDVRSSASQLRRSPGKMMDKFREDIMEHGIQHGRCSMYNVMHLATSLGYKKIIFAGVDLYDSRYFWLPSNKVRKNPRKRRPKPSDRHAIAKPVLSLVSWYKKYLPDVEMWVHNPKSLLKKSVKVWKPDG